MEPELWDALEVGGGREDRATPCDSAIWSDATEGTLRSISGAVGLDEVYVPSVGEPGLSSSFPQASAAAYPWRYAMAPVADLN